MTDSVINQRKKIFLKGIKDGLPICLGYFPIAFAFGMLCVQQGLEWWMAVLISMTNLTSAGQFAGLSLIVSGGLYIEVAITTFVINIRYMLMSLAISQKVHESMNFPKRCLVAFGVTDEIFAVAIGQTGKLRTSYMLGLIVLPFLGWSSGTLVGATATGLLPEPLQTALGIAIYGMFLAVFVPAAKKAKPVLITCIISIIISCIFRWVPVLNQLSVGWVIIIAALISAGYCAIKYPIKQESQTKEVQA